MISKRDSKPFLIKFPIGTAKTNKADMQYGDDWQTVYGLISDPSGRVNPEVYGNNLSFDKVVILNANSTSRMIDYDTLIMLDDMPTDNYKKGDYYVSYIYPEYNREIVIGLNKVEAINMPKLYFEHNGQILYFQSNFDKTTLRSYVKRNQYIPFEVGSYVWTREPADTTSTKNRLRLASITTTGMDNSYKPFSMLEFVSE